MTLLLGPAGSGRSTLLKALCGQLGGSRMVHAQGLGRIRYNGQTPDTFVVQRTASYVDQVRVYGGGQGGGREKCVDTGSVCGWGGGANSTASAGFVML
jgi:energy-coupling factor transporter ATP-binding protein EcfA2